MIGNDMRVFFIALSLLIAGCGDAPADGEPDRGMLRAFAPLPEVFAAEDNPITPAKVELGRRLYHDPRLSKAGDVSCASCHPLDRFGADGKPVSVGHRGQQGARNSPTVFNAAGQFVQFWDGRAATIEEQAKGPVLNPVEMAMDSAEDAE
ncbi:MAG: cytochrome-c peroxidase, partial [bacterium]|nr:cytochrome-c peroxidase [bacterium]